MSECEDAGVPSSQAVAMTQAVPSTQDVAEQPAVPKASKSAKSPKVAKSPDNAKASKADKENASGIEEKDMDFLLDCLSNTNGGTISVDNAKVAAIRGMINQRSVNNRVLALKKKYNLPFSSAAKASDARGDAEPAVSRTPAVLKTAAGKVKKSTAKEPKAAATRVIKAEEDKLAGLDKVDPVVDDDETEEEREDEV